MENITLNNDIEMPVLGYGVYLVDPAECKYCVSEAIKAGYRSIDAAQVYFNEEGVGAAIAESGVPRNEIFLTTKVWIMHSEEEATRSIDASLKRLGTDYVDLLLLHHPFGDLYGTYRAIEKAYRDGKARAIGISNFNIPRFLDIATNMEVKPAVLQSETHVYNQQNSIRETLGDFGTHLEAWGPLAQGNGDLHTNPTLRAIGERYGKSNAQVALKFLTQQGIIAIPKSSCPERMRENIDIFDFSLTADEMKTIKAMNTNRANVDFDNPDFVRMMLTYKGPDQ